MLLQRVILWSEIDHLISTEFILLLLECLECEVVLVKPIRTQHLLETLQVLVLSLWAHDRIPHIGSLHLASHQLTSLLLTFPCVVSWLSQRLGRVSHIPIVLLVILQLPLQGLVLLVLPFLQLLAGVTLNTASYQVFQKLSLVLRLSAFIESDKVPIGLILLTKDGWEYRLVLLGLESPWCLELLTLMRLAYLTLIKCWVRLLLILVSDWVNGNLFKVFFWLFVLYLIEVKQFACMRLFHLQVLNSVESQSLHTLHSFSLGRLSLSLIRIQVNTFSVVLTFIVVFTLLIHWLDDWLMVKVSSLD